MTKSTSMGRKVLVAALLASAGAGLPQVAIAQQAEEASAAGTEIIVTAQRREERAQDVPIMITAVSAEGLRERAVTDLQGLQNQVPSLIIAPNGQTNRDVMSPSIRGQGTSFQGSPGVVVYMNEVPLIPASTLSSQGGPGNFVDLQSVQVLSGVQGTLFGRNTTGGAVLLTAAKPTNNLEGSLSVGLGNYNLREIEAVVNVPLTDKLAVRLVGATRDRDGFTEDLNWNKDRDDQHWRMGRIGIQWNPTDAISSYTMGYYGSSKGNGTGNIAKSFNYTYLGFSNPSYCANAFQCTEYRDLIAQQEKDGVRKVRHGIDGFTDLEAWSVMNNTDVELADNLKLKNIISYGSIKSYYAQDSDGTTANTYNTGNQGLSRLYPKDHFNQFTEELQFQGDALDKKLSYTAGVFYSHLKPGGPMRDYSTTKGYGFTTDESIDQSAIRDITLTNESTALFAQATLDLGAFVPALDKVRLTGGYRYNWDKVGGTAAAFRNYDTWANAEVGGTDFAICSFNGAEVTLNGPFDQKVFDSIANGGCRFSGQINSTASTWTVGLDYQPVENLLLYSKVSRGYKVGGFNGYAVNEDTGSFGSEIMTDYELGFKSDFTVAGRKTRLNVNGFHMDYQNIQRGMPDVGATSGTAGAVIRNTPSARIRGVEVEAMIRPVDGLEIGGNYSYIDAKYKKYQFVSPYNLSDCNSIGTGAKSPKNMDLACIPLQYLAPNIFSVYGRLNVPVPESVGDVSLFVSYSWSDKQHTAPGALEKTVGTGAGAVWEPGVVLPSYGLLSATLNWNNFLQSGLDVSVFGTNLTNKTYAISNTGTYGSQFSQTQVYGEPRMYGIRLKYKFGN